MLSQRSLPKTIQTPTQIPNRPTVTAARVDVRSNGASYFLPGWIEGRPIQFLVDTGCTVTNLLSKAAFGRLPNQTKKTLEESLAHEVLVDGSQLPFYVATGLCIRVRDTRAKEGLW